MPESPPPFASVAFAGYGATTAVGCGVEALRSALRANASGLRACERFDSPRFQSSIVGAASQLDARSDDPAWQLADQALREAREQAREVLSVIPTGRVGLVLSTTKANIEALERLTDSRPCSETARRHLQGDLLAADLAAAHGARGPVQCVSLACASGLIAIAQGAKLIQRGAADAVLVVGADHLSAFVVAGFTALKAIDPNGCRPFDRERRGLSPGEAGAAIVLVRSDSLAEISPRSWGAHAPPPALAGAPPARTDGGANVSDADREARSATREGACAPRKSEICGLAGPSVTLRGWGGSNDANHMTGPARDGSGLARAIRGALQMAGLQPQEIDYVNAHGTGTPYNDAMEAAALRTVFGENGPPVSGLKGMLGHTLGAAGVVETILCVLAMQESLLPGTPRLNVTAEDAPLGVLKEPRFFRGERNEFRAPGDGAARLRHVLKLNTGFGGVNGALILHHG